MCIFSAVFYVVENDHWGDLSEWRVAVSQGYPVAIIYCNPHLQEIIHITEELCK